MIISVLAITRQQIVRFVPNFVHVHKIRQEYGETLNFENSRWPTAAILKMVISPHFIKKLSDFEEISSVKQI